MKRWKQVAFDKLRKVFSRARSFHRTINVLVGNASYYVEEESYDFSFDDMYGNFHPADFGKTVIVRLPYELSGEDAEIVAVCEMEFLEFLTRNFTVREILDMRFIEFNPYHF